MSDLESYARRLIELGEGILDECRRERPTTPPRYMKVSEYASHRRVSESHVRHLIKIGLPVSRTGRVCTVRVQAADLWLDNRAGPESVRDEARGHDAAQG